MKNRTLTLALAAACSTLVLASAALAGGNGPAQLGRAGWLCVNAGPDNYVHCFPPGAFKATETLTVRVFETTDTQAEDAHFLGTELLIRDDIYAGQPCVQNDEEEYDFLPASATGLPADYRACHHYATGH